MFQMLAMFELTDHSIKYGNYISNYMKWRWAVFR